MGKVFGGAPKGPSAEELAAQREQRESLKRQEEEAIAEKAREDELTAKRLDASKRQRSGRGSLIATSELGTKGTLG